MTSLRCPPEASGSGFKVEALGCLSPRGLLQLALVLQVFVFRLGGSNYDLRRIYGGAWGRVSWFREYLSLVEALKPTRLILSTFRTTKADLFKPSV